MQAVRACRNTWGNNDWRFGIELLIARFLIQSSQNRCGILMLATPLMRQPLRRKSLPIVMIALGLALPMQVSAQSDAAVQVPVPVAAPPGPPAPTASVEQSSQNQAGYRINAGDELEIYVWGEARLQKPLRVLPDGTVAFPLAGQLAVAGLLPREVEQMVTSRLSSQYKGDVPNVTVSVLNPAGMQFSVMGRVRSPGSFTSGRYANILNALSMAGGPVEFANLDNIQIIRQEGNRTVVLKAKMSALFKGNASQSEIDRRNIIQLLPGDVVIVP